MDTFSLIVVSDETSPVRRFEVRKDLVRKAVWGAGIAAVLLLGLLVDYVRVRVDNLELDGLRAETLDRREQVANFEKTLEGVDGRLNRLLEFERKLRIIANLPGSAAAGGEEITAVGDDEGHPGGEGGPETPMETDWPIEAHGSRLPQVPAGAPENQRIEVLDRAAAYLAEVAAGQGDSLESLIAELEGKHNRLASSPSIWPAKGWLTSRYGYRVSPFTGRKQFHAGIDIAGAKGTEVVAPAHGTVVFAGNRGPLGNSLIIDHGHGVRTQYGHNSELFVKKGDTVERGQKIAALGNTGRSTGPHLHYVVEVNRKTRDPLDYIFD